MASKVLIDPNGDRYQIPVENLDKAISQGFREETKSEAKERIYQARYGEGVGNELLAGAAGAARSATFGISDFLIAQSGKGRGRSLRELQERNPVSSLVGEVGGMFIDPTTLGANLGAKIGIRGAESFAKLSRAGFAETLAKKILPDLAEGGEKFAAHEFANAGIKGLETNAAKEAGQFATELKPKSLEEILSNINEKAPSYVDAATRRHVAEELFQKELGRVELANKNRLVVEGLESQGKAEASFGKTATDINPNLGDNVAEKVELGTKPVGFSENLGKSILKDLPRKALSNAFQAAAITVGQEITEDALGRHELNAEKMLASVAANTLFGAGIGGALFAGEKAILKSVEKVLDRPNLIKKLDTFASKEAFQSFKPFRNEIRAASKKAGGVEGVGREIIENGFHKSYATVEDKLSSIRNVADDTGSKIGKIVAEADSKIPSIDGKKLAEHLAGDLKKLARNPFLANEIKGLIKDVNKFAAFGESNPLTLTELQNFRQQLDGKINFLAQNKNPLQKSVEGLRSKLESTIKGHIEETLGKESALQYQSLKDKYGRLKLIEKMAARQYEANVTKSFVTGLDTFAMGGHAALALLTGNPAIFAGGVGTTLLMRYIRNNGASLAADAASKLARLKFIANKVETTDKKINGYIDGFLQRPTATKTAIKLAIRNTPPEPKNEKVDEEHVQNMASNPGYFAQHMERTLPGMGQAAPKISMHANMRVVAAMNKLSTAFAKPISAQNLLQIQKQPKIRDMQMHRTKIQMRTIKSPLSVLEDLQNGKVSKEAVATLKEVYPNLYDDIRTRFIQRVAEKPDNIDYQKRLQLSHLFGAELDKSLEPGFKQMIQKNFAVQQQQTPDSQRSPSSKSSVNPAHIQTDIDRVTYG